MSRPTLRSLVMSTVEERNLALISLISDLLVEVEALREAVLRLSAGAGTDTSSYREAYREAALIAHNSAGTRSGLDKLLDRFYPGASESGEQPMREVIMPRRLGMSQPEIEAFEKEAKELEMLT